MVLAEKIPRHVFHPPYTLSLMAAMSQYKVHGVQIVQGTFDASLFSNFIYELLRGLQAELKPTGKRVLLFIDNARIHHGQDFLENARKWGADVLFNA